LKTVDFKTVMGWNPCTDFPRGRVADLFAGRERVNVADVFSVDMRQDEQLWCALREAFFTQEELEAMGAYFVLHASRGADKTNSDVTNALLNAIMASTGNFEMLPKDKRQDRWKKGATEPEKCAALAALWSAQSRADAHTKQDKRLKEWNKERDWQMEFVKEKAGV
jgi:hypothetical protein